MGYLLWEYSNPEDDEIRTVTVNTQNKYNSKVVFWNALKMCSVSKHEADSLRESKRKRLPDYIYRFDSTLEFRVYLALTKMYGASRVKRQISVPLIPHGICYPKGKAWKIDFAVVNSFDSSKYAFYVEAKGRITPEFRNVLPILEHTNPDVFNRLFLVFGTKIPTENRVVANLLQGKNHHRVHTLKSFSSLTRLI